MIQQDPRPVRKNLRTLVSDQHPTLEKTFQYVLLNMPPQPSPASLVPLRDLIVKAVTEVFAAFKEPAGFAVHDAERFVIDFMAWQCRVQESYDFRGNLRALTTPTVRALHAMKFAGSLADMINAEVTWRGTLSDRDDWGWQVDEEPLVFTINARMVRVCPRYYPDGQKVYNGL